jgi:hypothetical protein
MFHERITDAVLIASMPVSESSAMDSMLPGVEKPLPTTAAAAPKGSKLFFLDNAKRPEEALAVA